jgi:D-galactarolactone isomerase
MSDRPLGFPGACDTHMHFYSSTHPTSPKATLFPPDATVDDYRTLQDQLGLERVVVVQPTTYGLDNRCQLEGMAAFGDAARGVMVVDSSTPAIELERLSALGVVGARFHMLPGGAVGWTELAPTAAAIADHGWHIQLQLDGNELDRRFEQLTALPTPLVVDHIGRFMPPTATLDAAPVRALCSLLDAGRTWVKLSAPYESTAATPPTHPEVLPLVDHLVRHWPERLVWASNWPHPGQARPLTPGDLADLAERWLPTPDLRRRVLVDNAAALYGFDAGPTSPAPATPEESR